MDSLHAFLLALIQGLTEFLPISSYGHLVLLPKIMDWQDQGPVVDIAAHLGSLFAVLFYFRGDLHKLIKGWFASFNPANATTQEGQLAWLLVWGTLPLLIAALIFHTYAIQYGRNAIVIAIASILFGVLLWLADWRGKQTRQIEQLTVFDAILIGFAQATALIPGASRSGVTMTAGLWLGLTRVETARFSFLLAIPATLAAIAYGSYQALQQDAATQWEQVMVVVVFSAVFAFLCIHWFIKIVSQIGMLPFILYRILLGVVLLVVFW